MPGAEGSAPLPAWVLPISISMSAVVLAFEEGVDAAGHAVHREDRDERHAEHVGEELELALHVGRAERDVMDASGFVVHGGSFVRAAGVRRIQSFQSVRT